MAKPDEHIKALNLRKKGISINKIASELQVSKGTVSLWVRDIQISIEQKQTLMHRNITLTGESKQKKSASLKTRIANMSKSEKALFIEPLITCAHKTFKPIELIAKPHIEKYFNTTNLRHEKINGRWFDFVNDEYVIEYTTNKTLGVSLAIERLTLIKNDPRKKFLVAKRKYFGNKRQQRLLSANATHIDINTIMPL